MKVLIVRLSALGDVIQGIPCLVALKESFPDWKISWLIEETSAPLLEGHPYIEKLFVLHRGWRKEKTLRLSKLAAGFGNFWSIWRQLCAEHFDVAIDLQGLFKSGLWSLLSYAPRRIGYNRTREGAPFFLTDFVSDKDTFDPTFPLWERYLEPARFLGADINKGRYLLPSSSKEVLSEISSLLSTTNKERPAVALCPWSAWPSKNWPLRYWGSLASLLAKDFRVFIIGGKAEASFSKDFFPPMENLMDLTGKTSLCMLTELFRHCQLVIGPDSGPLHLANATAIPRILMLFGSTSWRRSGPTGKGHKSISLDLGCQPCFERQCPLQHQDCLQKIPVSLIYKEALSLASINLNFSPPIQ